MVKLDRCVGSCNTLKDLSIKVCVSNKTKYLNLSVFNMESKTLTRHISCKCKCIFDRRKCNSAQWWNNDKCQYESKKRHVYEKVYVWNTATCNFENGKYLARITDDSVITLNEMKLWNHKIKMQNLSPAKKQFLMKRMQPVKRKISIFYLDFY